MSATDVNFSELKLTDLLSLADEVNSRINESIEAQKSAVKNDLEALAETTGRSVNSIFMELFPITPTVKYRAKHDPNLTWSGRGKQPQWLSSEIANGAKLEDFAA